MLLQASFIISYPLVNSNWNYSPEMPNLGQNRRFLEPCDLEIWRMTLKNNRAPLQHQAIRIISSSYVNSNWSYSPETVKLDFDLCDLDLWPLTLNFCMDITLVIGNVMKFESCKVTQPSHSFNHKDTKISKINIYYKTLYIYIYIYIYKQPWR